MPRHCKYYLQCHQDAVTYVPFSKVPLCKEHFLKNIEYRIRKTIDEFHLIDFKDPNEKIMVALSGGKDSASLLTMLNHVLRNKVSLEALFIDLGISPLNYSYESGIVARDLCERLQVPLHIVNVKQEYGFDIDDIHEIGQTYFKHRHDTKFGHFRGECSYCGLIKRYANE